jgi:membrane-bound lytic murein transglycosylase B
MGRPRRAAGLVLTATLTVGCASAQPAREQAEAPGTTSSAVLPERAADAGLSAPNVAEAPTDLAERLLHAETVTRRGEPADEVRQAAFGAQVLYRQLARTESWQAPVLAQLPRWLRPSVRAHVAARRDFRSMHSDLSRTLPAWRIVAPAPLPALLRFYREGQRRFGVPWQVLAAVNLVETGMGRIRGTSVAGARGPMQFMPATWAAYGRGDIDDPHDAILAAARYLAAHGGGRGRLARALYAYNHHPAYVRGVQAYAAVLRADPRALTGLYHWQVVYLSTIGDLWLPQGYAERRSVPARAYARAHPERILGTRTD